MLAGGASIGALDAATRDQDPGTGAALGAGAGVAGPAIGRTIGNLYQGTTRYLLGGAPSAVPENIYQVGGVSVPISSGFAERNPEAQALEQEAYRGHMGTAAQRGAADFFEGRMQPGVEAPGARCREPRQYRQPARGEAAVAVCRYASGGRFVRDSGSPGG